MIHSSFQTKSVIKYCDLEWSQPDMSTQRCRQATKSSFSLLSSTIYDFCRFYETWKVKRECKETEESTTERVDKRDTYNFMWVLVRTTYNSHKQRRIEPQNSQRPTASLDIFIHKTHSFSTHCPTELFNYIFLDQERSQETVYRNSLLKTHTWGAET
jgi:hypothetical protein